VLVGLFPIGSLFYAEEDWRGNGRWKIETGTQSQRRSAGLERLCSALVPDAQNFFKAPQKQEWFVKRFPGN